MVPPPSTMAFFFCLRAQHQARLFFMRFTAAATSPFLPNMVQDATHSFSYMDRRANGNHPAAPGKLQKDNVWRFLQ
ncbi:hypothetical protein DL89DRAFT_38273 [Linderina pennispora]|uniref:Uncharacterized protein n=1 Tax=Linderina pennispora TaxID=61395 RepID=A0A1Y1W3N5_9FUNG|nr:uncharacterized protein DL89DRAFT_38273 [Linderina pennispora]ORX67896.1 hypothetical protein DL89DRAFT_38273 [Linderina pennispora]